MKRILIFLGCVFLSSALTDVETMDEQNLELLSEKQLLIKLFIENVNGMNRLEQKVTDVKSEVDKVKQKLDKLVNLNQEMEYKYDGLSDVLSEVKSLISESKVELLGKVRDVNDKIKIELLNKTSEIKRGIANIEREVSIVKTKLSKKVGSDKVERNITEIKNLEKEIKVKNETSEVKELPIDIKGPRNCYDLRKEGDGGIGIRTVFPTAIPIQVVCDQVTENGGWTVFQTRSNLGKRENFFRNWADYSNGFGNMSGEFWLGLKNINIMTTRIDNELRIELEDEDGETAFAEYEFFYVANKSNKFKLEIRNYSGNAGDSLSYHNDQKFSTKDKDNDGTSWDVCAISRKGGWWYRDCANVNLNGYQYVGNYFNPPYNGIFWAKFRGSGYSMAKTRMMFRPKTQN